jgi:hypothetical protein
MRTRELLLAGAATLAVAIAGCGGGGSASKPANPKTAEASPPGDIPDNQAFVLYGPSGAHFKVKVPEGWSRTTAGAATTFTDKLNSITMSEQRARVAPDTAAGRAQLKRLATLQGFRAGNVSAVRRRSGSVLRITYDARGPKDPVTGRARTRAFERYEYFRNGRKATLTLAGAKGADNVDPWRIVSDSLRWTG